MDLIRRQVMIGAAALAVAPAVARAQGNGMYGLIGKMLAQAGQRDALAAIMLTNTQDMPGCLSYIVANDPTDENAIWITEVWTDQASHHASLQLPQVQEAIRQARPIIAGFGERFETQPLGGVGL
ncbi:putative quinol monooxygenase [Brevundimonas aveniformis]|uniref:putative quinol monooxygenase n=1 Tax=Brevundimonas aveniformis TaxID=370977 RepID=UPI002492AD53|nr:putative quinol monooxygenase [Brevundimonas aveniformis]